MNKSKKSRSTKKTAAANPSIAVEGVVYDRQQMIAAMTDLARRISPRRVTRKIFRADDLVGIPEVAWETIFGTFDEYLRQSDCKTNRYTARYNVAVSRHASVDDLRRIDGERKGYDCIHPKDRDTRWKTLIGASDFHDVQIDPFFRRVLTETVRVVRPDVICLNGDVFDLPEFGRYTVDLREWNSVEHIQFGLDICRKLREASPESQIDLIEANHEVRLIRHLSEKSPQIRELLSGLHQMDVRKLFKLDELEINYIAKADLFSFTDAQIRKEILKNYKIYWNSVLAHHYPDARNRGLPGFNGHHHKHFVWSLYSHPFGSYEWHQLGCGHRRDASYTEGAKWNNGFIIANIDSHHGYVTFEYVSVGPTQAVAAGNFYYRRPEESYPLLEEEIALARHG